MAIQKLSRELAQQAVDAVSQSTSVIAAAELLGLPRGTLENRLRTAKTVYGLAPVKGAPQPCMPGPAPTPAPAPPTPVLVEDQLRDRVSELESLIKTARENTLDDEYVKRKIIGLASGAAEVKPPQWTLELPRGKGLPGVPIAFWSDWHWGEVVFPSQVNDVNAFNMEIAHRRAKSLVERVINLLRNHVVQPDYPGLVLALGGDMMSGDIHEELSESNEMPVMPCLLDLFGVLRWAISTLADEFGSVFVPCVTGNHGRNTKKPRAKGRNFSNFDWLLYQFLAKTFEGDARVVFYIPDGPDALFRVFGHRYLLTHGDQFRGGDGIIGALGPITRGGQKKLARNAAVHRAFDTMMLGHWHQYLPLHRTLVNGSLKGYDEYANANNFGYEPPIQALWLTHPQHGVTMHMPVYLETHAGREESSEWVSFKDAA